MNKHNEMLKRAFQLSQQFIPIILETCAKNHSLSEPIGAEITEVIMVGIFIAVNACKAMGLDDTHKQIFLSGVSEIWDAVQKKDLWIH